MGQLDASKIVKALKGLFSVTDTPSTTTDADLVMFTSGARRKIKVSVTDGGTAGTAQTATSFFTNDFSTNIRIISAKLITPVAVTANDTNYGTATLDKVDATGANAATIAASSTQTSGSGGSGSLTAHVPFTLPKTVANVILPSGWTLRIAVSKTGTGVAIAAATSQAYVEVIFECEA